MSSSRPQFHMCSRVVTSPVEAATQVVARSSSLHQNSSPWKLAQTYAKSGPHLIIARRNQFICAYSPRGHDPEIVGKVCYLLVEKVEILLHSPLLWVPLLTPLRYPATGH